MEGRFRCYTDEQCLVNGRKFCDNDPNCHGIMWFKNNIETKLRICKTKTMVPQQNWRTMIKQQIRMKLILTDNLGVYI